MTTSGFFADTHGLTERGRCLPRETDHMDPPPVVAHTASDWAGDREERRSVNGGMLVHGRGW